MNRPFYQVNASLLPGCFTPVFVPLTFKRPLLFTASCAFGFPPSFPPPAFSPFLTACSLSLGFSEGVIPCQPCDSTPFMLFNVEQNVFGWMLLTRLPHRITSAYKFSVDGPLGVKLLTLAGLVARSVQCLFFCFVLFYNPNYFKFNLMCCFGAFPALEAEWFHRKLHQMRATCSRHL